MQTVVQRIAAFLFVLLIAVAARADEASVKRAVEARFGGIKIESIHKTPYFGLYEMLVGEEIFYTDEKVTYLFNGSVIDAKTRRNLTEERLQKLSTIKFDDLPLELAIKQVRGNGKRVVAVFSDPFCPFCKRLDQGLSQLQDVTVYTFLYPILRPEQSPQMAARIWCSPDRAKAYYDLMLNNTEPGTAADCKAPVDRWLALGQKLAVRATPVSFVPNGQRVVGARFEDLQKLMNDTARP
jgi:thiol:disulfide interchange protein DsbC